MAKKKQENQQAPSQDLNQDLSKCQDSSISYDPVIHQPQIFTNKSLEELRSAQGNRFQKKEAQLAKFTPVPPEYMAKIRAQPNTGFDKIVDGVVANIQRPQKKLIQIDTAETKKIVWYVCQKKAQLLNREFALTDFNKNLLKELTLYFSNDPSCVYDLQKGLLFMGGVGLGKTFLMDVFRTIASQTKVKSFRMVTTHDVYDSIALSKTDNQLSNIEQYYRGHYCFDDLGHEPTTFKHYGNDIALMEKIITERYKRFVNGYCLTHMVTNLDFEMINDRYGLRVYDRIRQMFNLVLFDGESMR